MKAHQLLADKSKWTTGARGRNLAGKSVGAMADGAVSWCANGAIERCYGHAWNQPVMVGEPPVEHDSPARKVRKLCEIRYPLAGTSRQGMSLSEVNDRRGYEAVMALLMEADV